MKKVAIVDKQPGHIDYVKFLELGSVDCKVDILHLSSIVKGKVLKADVDLDINVDEYDFIILIGSEACKHIAKVSSVMNFAGQLVDEKFIPMINPAMLSFKPDLVDAFDMAAAKCRDYIAGVLQDPKQNTDFVWTEDADVAMEYITSVRDDPEITKVAWDSETSALYPRDGYVLGISLTHRLNQGIYISADCLTEEHLKVLQQILNSGRVCVFKTLNLISNG